MEQLEEGNNLPDPKTVCDLVYNKSVIVNGKKLGGCTAVTVCWDIDHAPTQVTLKCVIKKDSLVVTKDTISFDLIGL